MSYIGNEPIVSATRTVTESTATAGQTSFTANGGYTVGYIDVFVNGAQLQSSDFTATNGYTVTLTTACAAGDDVKLVAWGTFSTSSSYSQAQIDSKYGAGGFGFKNRIINGDMRIDQRNAGAAITVNSNSGTQFSVDRFLVQGTTSEGVFTAQQLSATPPSGFTNYLQIKTTTASASPASGSLYAVSQIIEGYNIADFGFGVAGASTVTFSFRARSSLTGTFSGSLKNGNAFNRSYPFTYTINSANTWEYKTVTISGDTSGTWQTANLGGLIVYWDLGCGSSLLSTANAWQGGNYNGVTGSTRLISTLNATLDITGVQLEVGSTATSFDYRDYGRELAMCQRYCEVGSYCLVTMANGGYGNSYSSMYFYKSSKRASPSVTVYPSPNLAGTAGQALLSASASNTNQIVSLLANVVEGHSLQYTGSGSFGLAQYSFLANSEL